MAGFSPNKFIYVCTLFVLDLFIVSYHGYSRYFLKIKS